MDWNTIFLLSYFLGLPIYFFFKMWFNDVEDARRCEKYVFDNY